MSDHLFPALRHSAQRQDLEAKLAQTLQRFGVGQRVMTVRIQLALLKIEHKDIQPPLGCNPGIQLAQRACRRIPGICHQRLSRLRPAGVDVLKYPSRHKDLSPHGKAERFGKLQRNGIHRFEVLRHVLADHAVSPCSATDEHARLVGQRHRKTVDLRLHRISGRNHLSLHAAAEVLRLLKGKHVRQRVHPHAVRHLFKFIQRLSSHPLGRGGGAVKLRILLLQPFQLGKHPVVFVIGDLRCVVHIIFFRMVGQLRTELFYPFSDLWRHIVSPDLLFRFRRTGPAFCIPPAGERSG